MNEWMNEFKGRTREPDTQELKWPTGRSGKMKKWWDYPKWRKNSEKSICLHLIYSRTSNQTITQVCLSLPNLRTINWTITHVRSNKSISPHLIFEQAFHDVEAAQRDIDAATNDVGLGRRLLHDGGRERLQCQSQMIAAADVGARLRQFPSKLVNRTGAIHRRDAREISCTLATGGGESYKYIFHHQKLLYIMQDVHKCKSSKLW